MGKFKDLRVWQDAVGLAERIYGVTRESNFARDFGLKNQIQRAVVSIASNISEGDERSTNKEAVYYFNIAKGSAAEVITQLNIAHRIGYLDKTRFEEMENQTEKIRASLNKLIQARNNG
jgi:four helix bundle protein